MTVQTVTGLYDRYENARQTVLDLEADRILAADISLLANNSNDRLMAARTAPGNEAGAGAGTGGGIGVVVGGGAGLLAGLGMLAIPGVGPIVAAGWLVATAVGAAGGAAVGAAAGGIIGSMTEAGVDRDDANFYAEGVRRGGAVVTAKPDEKHLAGAEQILGRRAVNATERGKYYRDAGW